MPTFVDPRTDPHPPFRGSPRAPAEDQEEEAGLVEAISDGRFHDVERRVQGGAPLQFLVPEDRRKCPKSPLQASIRTGQQDVVLLLFSNGEHADGSRETSPRRQAGALILTSQF